MQIRNAGGDPGWDPDDYQGRSYRQVSGSIKIGFFSSLCLVVAILALVIGHAAGAW